MSSKDKTGWITKLVALLPIAVLGAASYWLLATQQKFDGGNAIMLFLIGCVSSLFIYYSERIEIIKAFGAELKFKRLAEQAEDTIEKLEASRLTLFRTALRTISMLPKSEMIILDDNRVYQYQEIVEEIKEQGLFNDLRKPIAQSAWVLMEYQHHTAENFTNIYKQRENDDNVIFRLLDPYDLISRAKEAESNAGRISVGDPMAEESIRRISKEMPILLKIYEEANKSPSE